MEDGDQHVAFKTLKLLRPWQPASRAQLKSSDGCLLSPAEELKMQKKGSPLIRPVSLCQGAWRNYLWQICANIFIP